MLCEACAAELPWLGPACERCALPLPEGAGTVCGRCLAEPPPIDRVHTLFRYAEPVSALIGDLKFRHRLWVARWCGDVLAAHLASVLERRGVVIPVPLHAARLRERGFNQALEIARPLARGLGASLRPGWVVRCKPTAEQTALSAAARWRNLRGAFAWNGPSVPERVLLVDDVLTTGATAGALATLLKGVGVQRVEVVTVARTVLD